MYINELIFNMENPEIYGLLELQSIKKVQE